jgi:bifunctional non-homologous end joining protein LigD
MHKVKTPIFSSLAPMLACPVKEAPRSAAWLHEVKFDGYRMLLQISRDSIRLISRRGRDWTKTFRGVADAGLNLAAKSAWIDGEIVAIDVRGRVSFQDLQNGVRGKTFRPRIMFYAFDLPYLDGFDLRQCTLLERKGELAKLLSESPPEICHVKPWEGDGREYFAEACRHRIEGIVSKRKDSRYVSGKTDAWRKTKCETREQLVVAGFTRGGQGFSSLLLGAYDDAGKLHYAGRVKMGWNATTARLLADALRQLERKTAPYIDAPDKEGAVWVSPRLVAEIAYLERTRDGALRHASFKGICNDITPESVRVAPRQSAQPLRK